HVDFQGAGFPVRRARSRRLPPGVAQRSAELAAVTLYDSIGGAEGCRQLSAAFYARVARDPVLRPIFPKSFHCAIPAFAAYLAQFLGGGGEYSGRRWPFSLRGAHGRFN